MQTLSISMSTIEVTSPKHWLINRQISFLMLISYQTKVVSSNCLDKITWEIATTFQIVRFKIPIYCRQESSNKEKGKMQTMKRKNTMKWIWNKHRICNKCSLISRSELSLQNTHAWSASPTSSLTSFNNYSRKLRTIRRIKYLMEIKSYLTTLKACSETISKTLIASASTRATTKGN